MTKAEELKLLAQIDALIKSADAGDYIPMTFAGVVDVCKRNIEDDFGDSPVEDCANMRVALDAERRMHDETKHQLADAQKNLKEAIDENDKLCKQIIKITDERDAMSDCVNGNAEIISEAEAEIRKLKAKIVRMRMERMTEDDMAELYEKIGGCKNV